MGTRFAFDVIGVLDALYSVEQSADAWTSGLLAAAERHLSPDRGVACARYDINGGQGPLRALEVDCQGAPDGWKEIGLEQHRNLATLTAIRQTYASYASVGSREFLRGAQAQATLEGMQRHGVGDQWLVNGLTGDGSGAALYLFAKDEYRFTPLQRELLASLARHLRTAYRLQQRIARVGQFASVDAILAPDGRLQHANVATESAAVQGALVEAVMLRKWARGRGGREMPFKGVRAFKGLVNATWTLVDWLDRDGKRYVLACKNLACSTGLALSARERHLATLAKLGYSNKEIAHELGLAHSTVRVLLARAALKLGVRSRQELVQAFTSAP